MLHTLQINKDENVHRSALIAIKEDLLEKKREKEREWSEASQLSLVVIDKNSTKIMTKKWDLRLIDWFQKICKSKSKNIKRAIYSKEKESSQTNSQNVNKIWEFSKYNIFF